MVDKESLVARMKQLEQSIEQDKNENAALVIEKKLAEKKKKEIEEVLLNIEEQFKAAKQALSEAKDKSHRLETKVRHDEIELAALKRELGRQLDKEKIDAEYLARVEAFRQKCLTAAWRKENRNDDMGAMHYQIDGAIHLAVAGQALLGDKRGLGKTLTSLIWLDMLDISKVIVIAPSDTMDNYIREIKLWSPHRTPIKLGKMLKGERDFVLQAIKHTSEYVLVLNYEAWRKDTELVNDLINLKAEALILDEAHRAKTLSTNIAKGIQRLRFGLNDCPECGSSEIKDLENENEEAECIICGHRAFMAEFTSIKNVLPMTGTPIVNKPQELFPQLRLIDPVNFKEERHFLRDFCKMKTNRHWTWQYGGEKAVVEKIKHRFLARDRQSAGVIIPPPTPVLHSIPKEEMKENYKAQYKAYQQIANHMQLLLDPEKQVAMSMVNYITALLRMRQAITWPAGIELKDVDENGDSYVVARLDVHESIKLDKAEELIREIIEEGERVVLFSQFKAPLEVLQKRLGPRIAIYNGDTSDYLKQQIQLDFDPKTAQSNPRYDAVLCNYKAAGEGLNFNSASQMIILDEEWSPAKMQQAYGRIDRLGQSRETTIHTIRVEKTVDDFMAKLIEEKLDMTSKYENQQQLWQATFEALRNGEM